MLLAKQVLLKLLAWKVKKVAECNRRFCERETDGDRKTCSVCIEKITHKNRLRRHKAVKEEAIRSLAEKIVRQSKALAELLEEDEEL